MNQPIQLSDGLIGVVLPNDAKPYILPCANRDDNEGLTYTNPGEKSPPIHVLSGHWKILGCCTKDEIDFDPLKIVERINLFEVYPDFVKPDYYYLRPVDSFRSLLTSKGIELNDNNKVLIISKN